MTGDARRVLNKRHRRLVLLNSASESPETQETLYVTLNVSIGHHTSGLSLKMTFYGDGKSTCMVVIKNQLRQLRQLRPIHSYGRLDVGKVI